MLLEALQNFEWYNEPENVIFRDKEICVAAGAGTDFWQGKQHGFSRDNGHFFFTRTECEFSFVVKWSFEKTLPYTQCGIMLRIDENNWIKASVLYDNPSRPMIGSSVTQNGCSDWAAQDIPSGIKNIWFKLKRQRGDYMVYYSLDGENYTQMRLAHLLHDMPEVKIGAYICNPSQSEYEAVLSRLEFV